MSRVNAPVINLSKVFSYAYVYMMFRGEREGGILYFAKITYLNFLLGGF